MNNPFIENGFLCLNVSINKLFIAKMPTNKVQQDLEGKTALDIFSTQLLIDEIKRNSAALELDLTNIQEKTLPQYLDNLLKSQNITVKETAENIVKKFGERLGVILLTLMTGNKENRLKRSDWNDSNWDYWKTIKNVILVGGLASSTVGEKLKYYAQKVFRDSGKECYNIILSKDSSNVAIKGCSTYIETPENNKEYLIFDFGQTFIKRSIIKINNNEVESINTLDKVLSNNVDWDNSDIEKEKSEATKLNSHIVDVIIDTINKVDPTNIGNTIIISIANYVRNGLLANRGGYGKLRLLSDNYEEYLSSEVYKKINKKFTIKLIHDGTAMAAAFSNYSDSVCISLGTAFGVGFPNMK